MKTLKIFQAFLALAIICASCKAPAAPPDVPLHKPETDENKGEGGGSNPTVVDLSVQYPDPKTPKVKTLLVDGFFTETEIKPGITLYSAEMKEEPVTKAHQTVFVLEVDLNNEDYKVDFYYGKSDTTSSIAMKQNAIAAINACYELEAVYCKTDGVVHGTCTLDPDHLRFWKHEAAVVGDGDRKIGIVHGAKGAADHRDGGLQALEVYKNLKEPDIFASAPMLIDDYDPVGASYVPASYTSSALSKLDGEDWRRHQGVRHPRVAVALTDDNDLLMVVVDGRFSGKAEGMSAKELTNFLVKYFNPRWAINMDGGGSSTMYIDGHGDPVNHVLNYPADNKKWDHYGQRKRPSLFLVKYAD